MSDSTLKLKTCIGLCLFFPFFHTETWSQLWVLVNRHVNSSICILIISLLLSLHLWLLFLFVETISWLNRSHFKIWLLSKCATFSCVSAAAFWTSIILFIYHLAFYCRISFLFCFESSGAYFVSMCIMCLNCRVKITNINKWTFCPIYGHTHI